MDIPETIYLQWHDEDGKEFDSSTFDGEGVTWSKDAINDDDELYYHVSEIERLRKALEFYADQKQWSFNSNESMWKLLFNSGLLDGDGYMRAQQALKEGEQIT